MSSEKVELDDTDWTILLRLQEDARTSIAALARTIGLSPTATTERVNRLLATGVISGFHATVDPARLGLPLLALIRLRPHPGASTVLRQEIEQSPDVLECHHTTGDDCFVIKVAARDMRHLEQITGRLAAHGDPTTSMVYSSPVPRRPFVRTPTP